MSDDKPKEDAPKINIRFLFVMCNDIDAVRNFYTELLGMSETSYQNDEAWGWLVYESEGFGFMFFRSPEEMPVPEEWVWQPGWGGDIAGTSWAINVPEEDFPEVYRRMKDAKVPIYDGKPVWRQDSYWGMTAKDPMGNSVEIYYSPAEKPVSTDWPD
jgi:catechol 2,3-dioxygenase-like lactoylglutathione lyase family enzyme